MYFLIYDLAVLSKGYGHFVYLAIVLASAYFLLSRQKVEESLQSVSFVLIGSSERGIS